jgi:hydrogenase maturation protease
LKKNSTLKTMFIGIGNDFRNDDGVGISIVRELQKRSFPNVTFLELSGEGTELMDAWKNAEEVYIFDAVSSGAEPGTIFEFNAIEEEIPSDFFNYSTHNFSLAEAVELSRIINQLPPVLKILGIEGRDFSDGLQLSPEVKTSADKILQNISFGGLSRDKLTRNDSTFLTVNKMQRSQ